MVFEKIREASNLIRETITHKSEYPGQTIWDKSMEEAQETVNQQNGSEVYYNPGTGVGLPDEPRIS